MDGDRQDGTTTLLRQLSPPVPAEAIEPAEAPGWHDDLRLFALTWAAGFVFFLAVLA